MLLDFSNNCENKENGFQDNKNVFLFIVYMIIYWTNIIYVLPHIPIIKLKALMVSYGILHTFYIYEMFYNCRIIKGIFLPFILFIVILCILFILGYSYVNLKSK